MFWGVIYNVWTYNRICFGNIKINQNSNMLLNKINAEYIEKYVLTGKKIISQTPFFSNKLVPWVWYRYEQLITEPTTLTTYRFNKFWTFPYRCLKNLKVWDDLLTAWLMELIFWKPLKNFLRYSPKHLDIDYIEFSILFFLTIILFFTGIFSSPILEYISINSTIIIDRVTLNLNNK